MTDIDDKDHDPDPYEWWDDEPPGPPQEEPYCYECNDGGCRECRPTPFPAWCAKWQYRLGRVLPGIRHQHPQQLADDPWAPQPAEPAGRSRPHDELPF